jgi:hypothetical protein
MIDASNTFAHWPAGCLWSGPQRATMTDLSNTTGRKQGEPRFRGDASTHNRTK